MKAYRRILSWLMTLLMLLGSIALDWKAPVLSKAETTGQDVYAHMNVTVKHLYYKKGPHIYYWFVKDGKEVNRYENSQGEPIDHNEGKPEFKADMTFFLEYSWNVKAEDMKYVKKGNFFDVKLPSTDAFKFNKVTKEDFEVEMKGGKKISFGSFSLDPSQNILKMSFDKEESVYTEAAADGGKIDNGYIRLNARLVAILTEQEIPIGNIITDEGTVVYKPNLEPTIPHGPFGGPSPANGDISKHGDWRENDLTHGPEYKDHILWYFRVNRKVLNSMYKGATVGLANNFKADTKKDVMLIDKLPEIYDVVSNSYFIYVDFLPPAINASGNINISNDNATFGNRTYYKFLCHQKQPKNNILELDQPLVTGSTAADLENKVKAASKDTHLPVLGFCNNSSASGEKDTVIMDLGDLPSRILKYTYVYASKDELKELVGVRKKIVALEDANKDPAISEDQKQQNNQKITELEESINHIEENCRTQFDTDLKKKVKPFSEFQYRGSNEITADQKEMMYEFYKDRFITDFVVSFRAKPNPNYIQQHAIFKNSVDLHYNNIKQATVPGQAVVQMVAAGAEIENIYKVKVSKQWLDQNGEITSAPEGITKVEVQLYKEINGKKEKEGDPVRLDASNNWSHTFNDLKRFEGNTPVQYSVEEKKIEGYVSAQEGTVDSGEVIIKNRVNPPIDITVEKKWKDGDEHLTKVKLILTADNKDTPNIVELPKDDGSWKHTFTGLPTLGSGHHPIIYSVREEAIGEESLTGYKQELSGDVENGFVITNTQKRFRLEVTKEWTFLTEGQTPPVSIIQAVLQNEKGVVANIELNEGNGWKQTVENLPEYDLKGHKIKYEIKEVTPVPKYNSDISAFTPMGENLFQCKIKNIEKDPQKRDIVIEKKWKNADDSDPDLSVETFPSVTVRLKRDGEYIGEEKILDQSNGWKTTYSNLEKVNTENGQEYVYTIEEISALGYEMVGEPEKTEETDDSGRPITRFVLTNKKTERISIEVQKQWKDQDGKDIAPDTAGLPTILVKLKRNDTIIEEKTLTAPTWKCTFSDLIKRDAGGTEFVYSLEEAKVEGYTTAISKNPASNFIITNTKEASDPPPPPSPIPPAPTPPVPIPPPDIPIIVPPDIEEEKIIEEFELDDDDIARSNKEEDEEILDDIPKVNKDIPKTHDFLMNGAANPLAVSTLLMMGYGVKKLLAKKKKK